MVQRHSQEITRLLQRLARLRSERQLARSPDLQDKLDQQLADASARLRALQRDTPIQTAGGTIKGRRVNNQPPR